MSNASGSSSSRQEARAEKRLRERLCSSLSEWATHALASTGRVPAAHHRLLLAQLEAVAAGSTRRLMVHMPPGTAKSTYASVLFSAWFLARRPSSAIIAACHTNALAEHFGRNLRTIINEHEPRLGYGLRKDNRATARFATTTGAEYFATGVNGHVIGRRADLLLIDDPIKSQADSDSPARRDKLWDWFAPTAPTRLIDDASLQPQENAWTVLSLPVLAMPNDPLGRPTGAPLWPEWEDAAALAASRALVVERSWAALYLQKPRRREGGLFTVARIAILDAAEAPPIARAVRAWDLAATDAGSGDPDWTVGLRLARTVAGGFLVEDVVRLRA
jgi:hypothetical protein